ncbi:hypothetical protein CPB84DRAFT_1762365 [Gymnopilus junonius]|uniref:Uncharacterized protein n=1 Tax=Gymnopilus junonius TaxID=109634 RepID=A0A9P5TTP7_GYMJU|nr:hypothetical protein CPB84DRAFT_1762365 [Gymnopilus junonius]
MVNEQLASALQLSKTCDEEEISSAIIALLTSAVHDSEPQSSLSEIYQLIANTDAASLIDPLNALPLLLRCDDADARNVISLMGEHSSAKEVVMVVQESLEALERTLESEDEGDEDQGKEGESKEGKPKANSHVDQLLALIDLHASVIPRLQLRRKSAQDTIRPLCKELEAVIQYASVKATLAQGRSLLSRIANLSKRIWEWVQGSASVQEDIQACKLILKVLVDSSLIACERFLKANSAQRVLEECYPRLAGRSELGSDWQEGEQVVSDLIASYETLGLHTNESSASCSAIDLLFSSHQNWAEIDPDKRLTFLLPALISSIESNTLLDQALAVLIKALFTRMSRRSSKDLPENIAIPLYSVVPSIASAHPDPAIRHQAFRVLSLLLACENEKLRFQHLIELTRESEYPQMRVAAVGLVKETLLKALSGPSGKDDLFLGPLFLRSFGPILFRPDPHDLFLSALDLKDFQETHEPARLAECLSLLYVLLQRDEKNAIGIRDKDVIKSIENNLLAPLRRHLSRWMDDPAVSRSHLHDIAGIAALQICLERVDGVRATLQE